MKRLIDFCFSIPGILILFPFFLIIVLSIKLDSKGPVLFKQIRVGRYGKPFTMIKFRTMYNDHSGSTISVKGESRITRVGAYLRKFKIDELPELWNVIKGEMSLVGPRPDVPGFADKLVGEQRKILELRPGITGPASLKYRDEEELLSRQDNPEKYNKEVIWPEKVSINLDYYYNHSVYLDLKILFQTIFPSDK